MKPSSLAAKLYSMSRSGIHRLDRRLRDIEFESWSGVARFRNRGQIKVSERIVLKGDVVLNGRSSVREHGLDLGPDTYIKERGVLDAYGGWIEIQAPVGIGQGVFMHGGGGLRIGSYVIMGPNCQIVASNHAFGSKEYPTMLQGDRRRGITIGDNVWLGAAVTVLDGVTIGDNVVIGAGVIVTHDVPSNSLVRPPEHARIEPIRFT
jgi:acetyltransferase-like isoleucine patch superfamily enzyme